jgi:hypothetical protein
MNIFTEIGRIGALWVSRVVPPARADQRSRI